MTILKKQFTREKWLMHFVMWDRSDRAGFERYAGYIVRNNLFYAPTLHSKVSVYYSDEEFGVLAKCIAERLVSQSSTWDDIKRHLDTDWIRLFPYLQREKLLVTVEDFMEYFASLTDWWTAMTIAFFIPDIEAIDVSIREEALRYRERSEKYAQISHDVIEDFWRTQSWPETQDLLPVVTPEEAVRVLRGECSPEELERLRARIQGYGMFDGVVYPALELKAAMDLQRVIVEEEESSVGMAQVSGRVAYTGRITARVCLVLKKADLDKFLPGDVIVAEMTSPDYMPWMKQAAGFVTDEGGLTCHAAIVARETQKPCVVGTKMGTRVFKMGDMIEVDATSGVVRRV